MPFITEEIWQRLPHRGDSIMKAEWPEAEAGREDAEARGQMETLIALITKVRNIRSEMNIPVQTRVKLHLGTTDGGVRSLVGENADQIKRLAKVEDIFISDSLASLESAARDVVGGVEVGVPLEGLIDVRKEGERITKEITRKENEARGLESRLSNVSFVERAPQEVVKQTRDRFDELMAEIEKLNATRAALGL
jgi:valyl-tRNA synthetase